MNIISRQDAIAKGLKRYFTGKPCKHGHVAERFVGSRVCTACNPAHQKKYHHSAKGKASQKRSYEVEKSRRAANDRSLIDARSAACRKWRKDNKSHFNAYMVKWRQETPAALLRNRLQTRLHHFLGKAGKSKALSFAEYVGCSAEDLAKHLEGKFSDGMSWDNRGEWHIDHIRPCASFDLTDPAQQRECFHYSNLQPLWAADNLRKSDTWQ